VRAEELGQTDGVRRAGNQDGDDDIRVLSDDLQYQAGGVDAARVVSDQSLRVCGDKPPGGVG
jgi:hypothetical protein